MWLSQYGVIDPWDPVRVTLNKRFHVGQRTDWAWATVEPPLLLGGGEHATVALGACHQGFNVWDPVGWPVHVYVCTTDPTLHGRDTLDRDALSLKAWCTAPRLCPALWSADFDSSGLPGQGELPVFLEAGLLA